jgi:hypothetical protein
MPNNYAARLRAIADKYKNQTGGWASDRAASIAALLAGAEALEKVEVARAALEAEAWKIGNGTPTMDGNSFYRILSGDQHAVATAYNAALARLEGK